MRNAKLVVYFFLYKIILKNFLRLFVGIKFPKTQKFETQDQFIIVCNHNSHLDTVSIMCSLPLKQLLNTHPVAAGDYFARNKITAGFFSFFVNTLFIDRCSGNKEARDRIISELDRHLKEGKSLIIFPEGSRGDPEVLSDFKHGVSMLLKRNPQIPFIPIYMKGMGKALPKGDPFLVPTDCEINVGQAVFINDENDDLKDITHLIKNSVVNLSEAMQ